MDSEKYVSIRGEDASNSSKQHTALSELPQRYDRRGLLLDPQPSAHAIDPLNWARWVKLTVLIEVSTLSFLVLFSASLITPCFVPLSMYLGRSLVETAYVTSTFILFVGVSAIVWNPISNVYGRRPVYILSIAVSLAMAVASGKATSFGALVAFRCIAGFFGGVPLGLGSATVCDMFFAHERGLYMGIYTVTFITGGHVAPIIGGFIEENLSWRWCFFIPAILNSAMLLLFVFTVPETLYSRVPEALSRPQRSWMQNVLMKGRAHPTRRLHFVHFLRPFQMLWYPSVLLPTLCYMVAFAYSTILFIITSSALFGEIYHYEPPQTGLLLGVPITVGSIIGEAIAGWLSDWFSRRCAAARGGKRRAEDRLLPILPATVLCPLGIIIEGACLENKTPWVGVAFGIAIASTGLQIVTTGVYTYTAECYKPQSPEIGSILNFARQIYSFTMGFYALPFAELIGVQDAWIVLAMIVVFFSFPLVQLYFKGESWRERLGHPTFHRDL